MNYGNTKYIILRTTYQVEQSIKAGHVVEMYTLLQQLRPRKGTNAFAALIRIAWYLLRRIIYFIIPMIHRFLGTLKFS